MPAFEDTFKPRAYDHFDAPLSLRSAKLLALDPERVKRHAFSPFISYTQNTPRYKRQEHKVVPKPRPLAYASHSDCAIYAWYGAVLAERYETLISALGVSEIPLAYRRFDPPKCNLHFARTAFDFIRSNRPCVALAFDITGFFDNLDHSLLSKSWSNVIGQPRLPDDHYKVYRSLTRYAKVEQDSLYEYLGVRRRRFGKPRRLCTGADYAELRARKLIEVNRKTIGIPQGSPMSAVLSNIYMLPFDLRLLEFVTYCGGLAQRYCDDILVVVPPTWENHALELVNQLASERKLQIQREKTDRVHFGCTGLAENPIQYLGLTFDGDRTLIRSQTLSRYHRKIRAYLHRATNRAAKNIKHPRIYKSRLHSLYSHRGSRNFISYADSAARVTQCDRIKRQVAQHQNRIHRWRVEIHRKRFGGPEL